MDGLFEIQSQYKQQGLKYLELQLEPKKSFNISERFVLILSEFINQAFDSFQGVFIHSNDGKTRAPLIVLMFLMNRFRWSTLKALEYLNFKKPDVEFTASILRSINDFEHKLKSDKIQYITTDWTQLCNIIQLTHTDQLGDYAEEELILTNTFINTCKDDDEQIQQIVDDNIKHENKLSLDYHNKNYKQKLRKFKVRWKDQQLENTVKSWIIQRVEEQKIQNNTNKLVEYIPEPQFKQNKATTKLMLDKKESQADSNLNDNNVDQESTIIRREKTQNLMKKMIVSNVRVIKLKKDKVQIQRSQNDNNSYLQDSSVFEGDQSKSESFNSSMMKSDFSQEVQSYQPQLVINRVQSKMENQIESNQKSEFRIKILQTQRIVSDVNQNIQVNKKECENDYYSNPLSANNKQFSNISNMIEQVSESNKQLMNIIRQSTGKTEITCSSRTQNDSPITKFNTNNLKANIQGSSSQLSQNSDNTVNKRAVNIDQYLRKEKLKQDSYSKGNDYAQNWSTQTRYNPLNAMKSQTLNNSTVKIDQNPNQIQQQPMQKYNQLSRNIQGFSNQSYYPSNLDQSSRFRQPLNFNTMKQISEIKQSVSLNRSFFIQRKVELSNEKQTFVNQKAIKLLNQDQLKNKSEGKGFAAPTAIQKQALVSLDYNEDQSKFFSRRAQTPMRDNIKNSSIEQMQVQQGIKSKQSKQDNSMVVNLFNQNQGQKRNSIGEMNPHFLKTLQIFSKSRELDNSCKK
ncbi:dual specificity catalytic domain containing protein [Stylonychia lemnae]|uniref:Dual specificity catalytic domain containing protein n=1 Tax=Stylonychia lemnae TaxID=5949 RepID=A0A078BA90_STYLE|nr:dual specificity catalytic domain containing protein [Stylonychia lemnae]|eukprot:CDW90433.1 dual specificity catalytic domain containing protein [Stylonychia lemnae]